MYLALLFISSVLEKKTVSEELFPFSLSLTDTSGAAITEPVNLGEDVVLNFMLLGGICTFITI